MANFLIVNNETGLVENCVALGENSNWQPPQGFTMYQSVPNVGIGWVLNNGEWIDPNPPEPENE